MAVPCPSCGREYDVTLFEFGRTIWCTCGRRVRREPRIRSTAPHPPRRFIADAMLGRLARWLRLLGFDCDYEPGITDRDLVRRGLEDARIVLTRDRALPDEWWVEGVHVVEANGVRSQLVEVVRSFDLEREIRLFARCAECNRLLEPAGREQVRDRVPPAIIAAHESFRVCPDCARVYWEGSHTDRFRRFVERVLEEVSPQ